MNVDLSSKNWPTPSQHETIRPEGQRLTTTDVIGQEGKSDEDFANRTNPDVVRSYKFSSTLISVSTL
ncbi:hypothetical protein M8J75_016040 [Diaphorina citri]|nr:hypothetical protein M8J75_016040 [Diaphorina citri]